MLYELNNSILCDCDYVCVCVFMCVMSVSVCDHALGVGWWWGYFDLHFSCLVCILFPSGNNLLMRQAGHSQKGMLTMRLHMNPETCFLHSFVLGAHTQTLVHNCAKTHTFTKMAVICFNFLSMPPVAHS